MTGEANHNFRLVDAGGKGIEVQALPDSQTVILRIVGFSKLVTPSYVLTGREADQIGNALKRLSREVSW